MVDCAIIGAGISGLTLGYYLRRAGISVTILEHSARVGGVIQTGEREGFLLEWGPNSTYAQESVTQLAGHLGLESEMLILTETAKKKFLVTTRGAGVLELVPVPTSFARFLSSPILSAGGKLRLLGDLLARRSRAEDESVEFFMTRHFGEEVTERIVDAVLSGVWATDISRLSMRRSLPQVWQTDQECSSVIRGMLTGRGGPKRPPMLTFRKGMSQLVDALRATFDSGEIVLGAQISAVRPDGLGAEIVGETPGRDSIKARTVVITSAAKETAFLLRDQAEISAAIRSVPYSPLGILHLAIEKPRITHPLDGFGFLCPPILSRGLLGAIFSSSITPLRAPEGYHLLTCFCGGARFPHRADVSDSEIQRDTIRDLTPLIGAQSEPRILSATFHQEAIPSYPVGHNALVTKIRQFEQQHSQLRIMGNWLEGLSVAERITQAKLLATSLSASLSKPGVTTPAPIAVPEGA